MTTHRNLQKIKTLSDFSKVDEPGVILASQPNNFPSSDQMILRMLVRPKYGSWKIPPELSWLRKNILEIASIDKKITGIKDSWCYVTVRHGPVSSVTDDEWHFDGASFRTDIIPERNYVWVSKMGPQYKLGNINWPDDFDPVRHNLFSFAEKSLQDSPVLSSPEKAWMLMTPFCFHRRNPLTSGMTQRTFIRISFPDIEGRDINNTHNSLLPTPFFGRDPVNSFRNNLQKYGEQHE